MASRSRVVEARVAEVVAALHDRVRQRRRAAQFGMQQVEVGVDHRDADAGTRVPRRRGDRRAGQHTALLGQQLVDVVLPDELDARRRRERAQRLQVGHFGPPRIQDHRSRPSQETSAFQGFGRALDCFPVALHRRLVADSNVQPAAVPTSHTIALCVQDKCTQHQTNTCNRILPVSPWCA